MTNKKICGLSLPEEVNEYIRQRAEHEHRSLANVVAMMAINYYNLKNWDGVSPLSDKVLENVPSAQPEPYMGTRSDTSDRRKD